MKVDGKFASPELCVSGSWTVMAPSMKNELRGACGGIRRFPMEAWHPHVSRRSLNTCMTDGTCWTPLDIRLLCLSDGLTSQQ